MRITVNDVISHIITESSDEDVLKLAYDFQMSNRGTHYYYEQYDELIKQKVTEIVEASEIPISTREARWDIYPVEEISDHIIKRYGDFTVSNWTVTRTDDSSLGKLYVKTNTVKSNTAAVYCTGTIKNNSTNTYYFVRIRAAFLNGLGEVVDTGWTYGIGSEGLEPGESTEFTIYGDKPHSTVKNCRITVLELPESEYVTSDTIVINSETEEYYKLMFHHVNLGDNEIGGIPDTYHYCKGYLIDCGEILSLIETDADTQKEMEEIAKWSDDDHTLAESKGLVNSSLLEAFKVAQRLSDDYDQKSEWISRLIQLMRYEGTYQSLEPSDSTSAIYALQFVATITVDINGNLCVHIKPDTTRYDRSDYSDFDEYMSAHQDYYWINDRINDATHKLEEIDGKDRFSAQYGYVIEPWEFGVNKITIMTTSQTVASKIHDSYSEDIFSFDYSSSEDANIEYFDVYPDMPTPDSSFDAFELVDKKTNIKDDGKIGSYEYTYRIIADNYDDANAIYHSYCEKIEDTMLYEIKWAGVTGDIRKIGVTVSKGHITAAEQEDGTIVMTILLYIRE